MLIPQKRKVILRCLSIRGISVLIPQKRKVILQCLSTSVGPLCCLHKRGKSFCGASAPQWDLYVASTKEESHSAVPQHLSGTFMLNPLKRKGILWCLSIRGFSTLTPQKRRVILRCLSIRGISKMTSQKRKVILRCLSIRGIFMFTPEKREAFYGATASGKSLR